MCVCVCERVCPQGDLAMPGDILLGRAGEGLATVSGVGGGHGCCPVSHILQHTGQSFSKKNCLFLNVNSG